MNQIIKLVIAALFVSVTSLAFADSATPEPHNKHPDSTKQGDYLKDQPGESSMDKSKDAAGTTSKDGKPTNLEKAKSHKEKPDAGGVDVKSK